MWKWAAAACRGSSHERANVRLQDALVCFSAGTPATHLFSAISDGAGSASLGGQGANLVCRSVSKLARKYFKSHQSLPPDEVIYDWLDETRDHLAAVANRRSIPLREFAATLVCVISDGHETLTAHVGDGCVVARDQSTGRWVALSWPSHGEYASTTFFVTDESELQLRISRHLADVNAVAVFSDGLERLALDFASHTPFGKFFDGVIAPVAASPALGRDGNLSVALKKYLASPTVVARTDDDKSLVLAVKQ